MHLVISSYGSNSYRINNEGESAQHIISVSEVPMLNVYFNFKLCVSAGRSGLTSDILCRGAAHSPLCQTYFNSVVLGIVLTLLIILETFLFACQVFNIWIEAIKVSISIKFWNKVFSCENKQWKFGPRSESLQVTTSHIHVMSPGIPYSFVSKTYILTST